MSLIKNPLLAVDAYKDSHFNQYAPEVNYINSYVEARSGTPVKFFGLQAFIQQYMLNPITYGKIADAEYVKSKIGMPFNKEDMVHMLQQYDGYWPVEIYALPEGRVYPKGTPLVQVRNIDPRFPWVPSYLETPLVRGTWYPSSVATKSYEARKVILAALERSGTPELIDFKLHDFGARGVSSGESAGIGGAAHLLNFKGTDTEEAIEWAMYYYGADVCGFSIPAAEHSTITSWGKTRETEAYRNILKVNHGNMVAVVSDSYGIFNAVKNIWGDTLRQDIIDHGNTVVIRPDSGDPLSTLLHVFEIIAERFGYTTNAKGYKVFPDYIRVIQGDGVSLAAIQHICETLMIYGYSIDNIAFGMGGELLQASMRDDHGFTMKASAISEDGQNWTGIRKDAPGKQSKSGIQIVRGSTITSSNNCRDNGDMELVYTPGRLHRVYKFEELYNLE